MTLADLVAGETDREKLFDELRGKPVALVRSLRDVVRRGEWRGYWGASARLTLSTRVFSGTGFTRTATKRPSVSW